MAAGSCAGTSNTFLEAELHADNINIEIKANSKIFFFILSPFVFSSTL
jgi:hypothetical protein